MGTISIAAYDRYVSKHVGQLNNPAIQPIAHEFPEHPHWIGNFILNRIFIGLENLHASTTFVILRRAEAAVDEWELACAALATVKPNQRLGYFKALRHLENAISAIEQAFAFGRTALNAKFFTKGDGSAYQRLNFVYNQFRHHDPTTLPDGDLHGAWITDEGFYVHGDGLTFAELRDMLHELARVADQISSGKLNTATS